MTRGTARALLNRARKLSNDDAALTFTMRDGTMYSWPGWRMFEAFWDALTGKVTDDTIIVLTCKHSSVWGLVKLLRMCVREEK